MLAVVLQALLPLTHALAMGQARQTSGAIAGFDIAQNLCRAPGDAAPNGQDPAPADHQQCCTFCLTAHLTGSFAPPAAPEIAIDRDYKAIIRVEATMIAPPLRPSTRQQQPRAPPIFI